MDNCKSDRPTARKKDVKCLKWVDDNCPGRATLKNRNIRITEHAQHDAITEENRKMKIKGQG